uniref:Uncharacterized protein n=1 Tax=Molossus molossus TaxID=27622 RepID=A0A7J8E3L5_MOLMO|nr:hypothetical protein HJG59_009066 [Molossus molossus]
MSHLVPVRTKTEFQTDSRRAVPEPVSVSRWSLPCSWEGGASSFSLEGSAYETLGPRSGLFNASTRQDLAWPTDSPGQRSPQDARFCKVITSRKLGRWLTEPPVCEQALPTGCARPCVSSEDDDREPDQEDWALAGAFRLNVSPKRHPVIS